MYYFLSLLTGILISVMVAFNGGLTGRYGVYSATVIIHIAGLILISAVVLAKRDRVFAQRFPAYLYLAGAIGVLTTIFNNLAFGRISVSAILALGLLGQGITGLVIDQYGLMGMPKHPFTKGKLVGLALVILGIAAMTEVAGNFEIVAVVVSFTAGVNIVISRTINAKLAVLTNIRTGTFYNYLIGLAGSIIVFLILGSREMSIASQDMGALLLTSSWWIYFGGILGVCVVLLSNVVVVKVSAFYLTLLIFIGQIFSGIAIDVVIMQQLSARIVLGGLLVAMGLCVNLILDSKRGDV